MTAQSSSTPVKIAWFIGVVAAFSIFAWIGAYSARMANDYTDYDQSRADVRKDTLKKVQSAENDLIEPKNAKDPKGKPTAVWVDQTKGTIRFPIEEAMARQIEMLKAKPPATGGEIPGAALAKPPATAPATNAPPMNAAPAKPAVSVNSPAAKSAKSPPKGTSPNTPPTQPDAKVKPPSPAAPTGTPTVPQPDAPNK